MQSPDIPTEKFAEFCCTCFISIGFDRKVEMSYHRIRKLVDRRPWGQSSVFQVLCCLAENPGIAESAPGDRNTIAAGLIEQFLYQFSGKGIPAGYYRYRQCLFNPSDLAIIDRPAVSL